jgi:nucleoside phosphorylase
MATSAMDDRQTIAGQADRRYAVILTAIEDETRAVLRHVASANEVNVKGTVFHVGQFGDWDIAVAECGAGNIRTAIVVERAIDRFGPEVACFVGVAGGVKDVVIGDVVVATKVYGYESGKARAQAFHPRPEVSLPAYIFDQRARAVRLRGGWKSRFDPQLTHTNPKIFVGAIAAGEKVVGSSRSDVAKFLKESYGDALAVEMEGRGFLDGVHINHPVQGCVVRGVADLLDNKDETDKAGWQLIAADAASAVAFEMLATLPSAGTVKVQPDNIGATPTPQLADNTPSPTPIRNLAMGVPPGKSPSVYFEPGEILAVLGEPEDNAQFGCSSGEGFYLRVIPSVPISRPLSRAILGASIREAGLFAMWRQPSGLFAQNNYGSIVVEPVAPTAFELKALSQLFPTGELWGFAPWLFVRDRTEYGPFIPAAALESVYRNMLFRYINFLSTHIRIAAPVVIKAGVFGLKGFNLAVHSDGTFFGPFYDNALEETFELADFSAESLNSVLLQFFEALFEASGYPRPTNLYNFPSPNT